MTLSVVLDVGHKKVRETEFKVVYSLWLSVDKFLFI